jgi:predicted DNA-binding ribbon-helix-helix protein
MTPIGKHSIMVSGQKTSVSLEDAFWQALRDLAAGRKQPVSRLVDEINQTREPAGNLSSAIRLYVLGQFVARVRAAEKIHAAPHSGGRLGNAA